MAECRSCGVKKSPAEMYLRPSMKQNGVLEHVFMCPKCTAADAEHNAWASYNNMCFALNQADWKTIEPERILYLMNDFLQERSGYRAANQSTG